MAVARKRKAKQAVKATTQKTTTRAATRRVPRGASATSSDLVDRKMAAWSAALHQADLLPMEIAIRVQRISLAVGVPLMELLRPHNIVPGDADVLANLFEVGEPYVLTPGRLAAACFVTTGAITGRIDRLERAGMVVRERSESDRRSQEVRLTHKGKKTALMIGNHAHQDAFARAAREMSKSDLQTLLRLLRELERRVTHE